MVYGLQSVLNGLPQNTGNNQGLKPVNSSQPMQSIAPVGLKPKVTTPTPTTDFGYQVGAMPGINQNAAPGVEGTQLATMPDSVKNDIKTEVASKAKPSVKDLMESDLEEVSNPFEGTDINPEDAYVGEYKGSMDDLEEVSNPFEAPTPVEAPAKEKESNIGAVAAVGAAGLLPAMYGAGVVTDKVGKAAQYVGKGLYGSTFTTPVDQAKDILQSQARKGKLPQTMTQTAIDQPWLNMIGTKQGIGKDAIKRGDKIFKETIEPIFDKADEAGYSKNTNELFDNAIDSINNDKKLGKVAKVQYTEALNELRKEYVTISPNMTLRDLQTGKVNIDAITPKKILQGKMSPDALNNAKGYLGNAFRDELHTQLGEFGNVDSRKLYQDWANLQEYFNQGAKDLSATSRQGGAGSATAFLADKLLTPTTTTAGKGLTKLGEVTSTVGKGLKYLPEKAIQGLKYAPELLNKGLKMVVKGGKVFTMIEDGSIIPGSPTNRANEVLLQGKDDYVELQDMKGYGIPKSLFKDKKIVKWNGKNYDEKGRVIY